MNLSVTYPCYPPIMSLSWHVNMSLLLLLVMGEMKFLEAILAMSRSWRFIGFQHLFALYWDSAVHFCQVECEVNSSYATYPMILLRATRKKSGVSPLICDHSFIATSTLLMYVITTPMKDISVNTRLYHNWM